MNIHDILLTVALITQIQGGKPIGSATGFFYLKNDRLYLVTNKHVFKDDTKKIAPETISLRLHTDKTDLSKNSDLLIQLYADKKPLWKVHKTQTNADVAIIELDKQALNGFIIKAFSKENFLPSNLVLIPGEDIFIMGYPLSFHDNYNNLPILRNAFIASTYGVNFQGQPLFLTDANLHPGTSGSPVITKPKNNWQDKEGNTNMIAGTHYYLIGIHSATLSMKETDGKETMLGLGASWYAGLIEEILE